MDYQATIHIKSGGLCLNSAQNEKIGRIYNDEKSYN